MMKNNNLKTENENLYSENKNISSQMSPLLEAIFDENDDTYTMRGLSRNATQIDKIKYQLCKDISDIQIRYKLSDEETVKRLKIDQDKITKINYSHYDELDLEELINYNYAQKLANSVEEEMIIENKYVKSYQHADHHINLNRSKPNNKFISMI